MGLKGKMRCWGGRKGRGGRKRGRKEEGGGRKKGKGGGKERGVTLGFCPGQHITIRQMHTADVKHNLWHADGRPFNYLDVEMTEPRCDDAYGVILGQKYQCKYVLDGEPFVWSPEQEEAFRLEGGLSTPYGAFDDDAT